MPGNAGEIDRAGADDLLELTVDRGSVPWQVGALLLLDRPLDPAELRAALARRVPAVPRLRRQLVRTPFLCGRPIWVDDPRFALDRHVRHVRCPDPGDDAALCDVAVQAVGTRLSLRHSPWAAVTVTGLAGGRGALVVVFHHVLADGVGGLAVLAQLVDAASAAGVEGFPARAPGRARLFVDTWSRRLRAHPGRGFGQVREAVRELRSTRAPRAPRCSLNRPTGPRRVLRVVRTDLAAVRAAAHARGGTVNDVVLTAVGGALGRLVERRGEHVDHVVASVPISARERTGADRLGNAVGVLPVSLPTRGPATARLAAVARLTAGRRPARRAASAVVLDAAFRFVAAAGALPWVVDHQRVVTTFVTNLRGPAQPLTFAGATVDEVVAVTTTTGNVPVVFAALSYAGGLAVSVVADPDACPEWDALAADLRTELDALVGAQAPTAAGVARPPGPSRAPRA